MQWIKWVVLAAVVAGGGLIWESGRTKRELTQATAEINRKAPVTVGPGVRIEKVVFAGKQLDMHVRMTEMRASDVAEQQAKLDTLLKTMMARSACGDPHMKRALSEHYMVSSIITGSDGREISTIHLSQVDCT